MVQGGAIDTGNNKYLARGVFEPIQGSESLKKAAKKFLDQNENLKNSDLTKVEDVVSLLNGDKSKDFLGTVSKELSEEEKFKRLAEQTGKDQVVMEKLEALGNQLLIQGVICGTAFATLTGALIGSLTIGGMAGALISGSAVLAGLLAIAAVVAICINMEVK
ncbi:hypothetical protein [Wolbachia pipientis]|uniref:hypothetical protein n=1 Tax=Wolbachia pipientis TaxID=955 RepID=UPI0025A4514F|nr:hypothetical protein [Wolbachia pipientis]MDM8335171.1 hypothetical protein [Wolbachia pipientis]